MEALEAEEKERLRKEEEKEKRKQYVEDWKREELEKKEIEKQKKKEEDEAFEERVKRQFLAAGYSEAHIESILREKRKKVEDNTLAMDLSRPTWIKVNRKYLVPETLEAYNLPWDFYEVSRPSSTRVPSTNKPFPKTERHRLHNHQEIREPVSTRRTLRAHTYAEVEKNDHWP